MAKQSQRNAPTAQLVADEVPFVPSSGSPMARGAPNTLQGAMQPYGSHALLPPGGEAGIAAPDVNSARNPTIPTT